MIRALLIAWVAMFAGLMASAPAMADKRVALVIGNSAYENVAPLPNPANDAADMAATLEILGFDVRKVGDLGKADMELELADFADRAAGADVAIVFYAGHGMEVDRQNYLIPVDASLQSDRRLRFETISLDDVLVALDAVRGVRIVLLDACRNNPFSAAMQVSNQSRSIGRGLSRVEAPSGTLISFAAKEGRVAEDGDGRNSPFTAALLENLPSPGVELGFVFRKVRDSVLEATGGEQEPYVSASLPGNAIFLVPPEAAAPPAAPAPGPVASAPGAAEPPVGAPAPPAVSDIPASVEPGTPIRPGDAVVTRSAIGPDGIDTSATVAAVVDLTAPGTPPKGQRLGGVGERAGVTAGEVGQVFATAIDDGGGDPDYFVAATSAFGLHRTADNAGWAPGMWGEAGGPGTIYVMRAGNGYAPEVFADVTLDGRANTGAALGDIALDRVNRQLFVSDLETGMIHRFSLETGAELGRFDHGIEGRSQFFDAPSGNAASLPPFGFDPASAASLDDCAAGDFAATPECWNIADFRRRVWGLAVRYDATTATSRLYYATWGSAGFGDPDWADAGDDQRNAIWSVGLLPGGEFDRADIRREFYLPDYFTAPENFQRFGPGHPVADIAFSACGAQDTMLLAERGGLRSLDPAAGAPFARPHESRILRFALGPDGDWQTAGRYDAGFYDRSAEGAPYIRSNAGGGVSFGPGFDGQWRAGAEIRNGFVWASADTLCSPLAACYATDAGDYSDTTLAHGLQGVAPELTSEVAPDAAYSPYPDSGPATPAEAPMSAFMVDLAALADGTTSIAGAEARGGYDAGATLIGDIEVYQPCPEDELKVEELPPPPYDIADVEPGEGWPEGYYPDEPFPEEAMPDDYDPGGYPPDPGGWEGWEPQYDLAIAKSGPPQCQKGSLCTYQLMIANYGPDGFSGPLAVRDQMPPGALFDSASPGWVCNPFVGDLYCTRTTHATLAAGETTALNVSLILPVNMPGNAVQNCAGIDWDAIGLDDGSGDGNDQSCIVTPLLDRFDLGIAKSSQSATCGAGGQCFSVVEITNHGPGEFSGPLAVAETLPEGATLASASGEWGCSQHGDALSCARPKKLALGESVTLTLGLVYPLDTPDGPLENCARIDFAATGATDGFADLAPDVACDSVDIHHDGFDLEITKLGPASCANGGNCKYGIEITNHGPNAFNGPLAFVDARPAGSTIATGPAGDWLCLPGGVEDEIKCSTAAAVTLAPGASRTAEIEVGLPNPVGSDTVESCASLDWGVMPLDLPGDTNDQSCATTNIGTGFDLVIAKTGGLECVEGSECPYEVTIDNAGPRKFEGTLALTDVLPPDAEIVSASPGWLCSATGNPDEVSCRTNDDLTVPASARATLELGVRLPEIIVVDTIENCASLDLPEMGYSGDADAANDGPACAATGVLDADVALFGGTTCRAGAACRSSVTLHNTGGRAFQGMLAINGELDPAVEIQNVRAPGRGWHCEITGPGKYRCGRTRPIRLEPGEAQKVRIVAAIPADFAASHIVHSMWLTWPDDESRDRNAANDANVSIIRINQPLPEAGPEPGPEPGPAGEPEPRPAPERPDLALTKTGPGQCVLGETCTWSFQVMNNGPGRYDGLLFVDDDLPGGTSLEDNSGAWSCEEADGTVGCRHGYMSLTAGQSVDLGLTLRVAATAGSGSIENCAAIMRPIGSLPAGMSANTGAVFAIQHALVAAGLLEPEGVDGLFGPVTGQALAEYQRRNGLEPTGRPNEKTVQTMLPVIRAITGDAVGGNDADCAVASVVEPACPSGSLWNASRGACVSLCRDDQFWNGQRCEPRCVSGERWTGRQCVSICRDDQFWNGERCESRCVSGERWNGRQCVSICPSDQTWNGQSCVGQCPSGERWNGERCVSLCRDDQRWNGERCVSRCDSGERWNGERCVSICGHGQRWDGQRCVSICPSGQTWNGQQCVSQCGRGERWNGERCVSICPSGQTWNGQQCVSQCGRGERWNGQRCVSQCGRGERWNGERCVSVCPSGQTWNGQQCVDRCPNGQTWNGKQCVGECPRGERWNGERCVSICGPNQRFNPRTGRCLPVLNIPPEVLDPGRVTPTPGSPGRINPVPGILNPGGVLVPQDTTPPTRRPAPGTANPQLVPQTPQLRLQLPQQLQQLQQFQLQRQAPQ